MTKLYLNMNIKSSGFGKTILIIIVAVVLAVGGYYLLKLRQDKIASSSMKKLTPTPTIAPTETPEPTPTKSDKAKTPTPTKPSPTPDEDEDKKPTPTKASDEKEENGNIEGTLGYPSEGIPPLEVYALPTKGGGKYHFIKTYQNQSTFEMEDIDPGSYYIVAYAGNNLSGGYTKAVACGLSVDCKDHSLISVEVEPGETAKGVEVKDWYAPEGTFPKKPQ